MFIPTSGFLWVETGILNTPRMASLLSRLSPVRISSVRAEEPGSQLMPSPHGLQDHTGGERSRGPDVQHRAGGEGRRGLAVSSPHWRLLIWGQRSQSAPPTARHPAPTPDASSAAKPNLALLSLNLLMQIPSGPTSLGTFGRRDHFVFSILSKCCDRNRYKLLQFDGKAEFLNASLGEGFAMKKND